MYGPIERIHVVREKFGKNKGKSRGYAFILYEREKDMKGMCASSCQRPNNSVGETESVSSLCYIPADSLPRPIGFLPWPLPFSPNSLSSCLQRCRRHQDPRPANPRRR